MSLPIWLPVGDPYRAILVPEEALGTDQGQKFVYVVDRDSRVQYRRVEVGKLQQGRRVVLKGLNEGERVVVSGLQRVRPGSVVEAKMASSTAQRREGENGVAQTAVSAGPQPAK